MKTPYKEFAESFGLTEPPILFSYTDETPEGTLFPPEGAHVCLFALLAKTRRDGTPAALSAERHGCRGGGYYLGFLESPREGIEHFLSCGIPGRMEGERYIKTPELARLKFAGMPVRRAPKPYALFVRADAPGPVTKPEVVLFFASPDVLAGLHFLASFDRADDAVAAPFSSACGAIVSFPLSEAARPDPRAVLGLFDPSARAHVERDLLTFAVPYRLFLRMAENAPESFLTTKTWGRIRNRIRERAGR